MTWLFVAVGGAAGAMLRFLVDRWLKAWLGSGFPWGTLLVNVAGSALLGAVAGANSVTQTLVGVGFCGALTTYSTFAYEIVELGERRRGTAVLYAAVTLAAGFGAALLFVR